jgi:uncharacterized protein YdaU (DUF1376 family)
LIARVSNERWTDVERTLQQFFNVTPTEWQHERIEAELEKYRDKVEKAKMAGKASARKRKTNQTQRTFNGRSTDAQQTLQRTSDYLDPDSDPNKEEKTDRQSQNLDSAPEAKVSDGRSAAFGDLKRMFNGSTESMIAFAEKAMGGHCRPNAEQWLASTVSAHGATFVAQAFAIMVEKQASGEIGARPLPQWSNIAAGLKARQGVPNPYQSTGKPTVSELLRRQREQEAA